MNTTEKRVLKEIIAQYDTISRCNCRIFSDDINASQATVTQSVKNFGYSGFTDMRKKIYNVQNKNIQNMYSVDILYKLAKLKEQLVDLNQEQDKLQPIYQAYHLVAELNYFALSIDSNELIYLLRKKLYIITNYYILFLQSEPLPQHVDNFLDIVIHELEDLLTTLE